MAALLGLEGPAAQPLPDAHNPVAVAYARAMLNHFGVPVNAGDDPTAMWRNYSASLAAQRSAAVGHGGADMVGTNQLPHPGLFQQATAPSAIPGRAGALRAIAQTTGQHAGVLRTVSPAGVPSMHQGFPQAHMQPHAARAAVLAALLHGVHPYGQPQF